MKTSPCPKCRENGKDRRCNNLHAFPNNNYCFACGFTEYNTSIESTASRLQGVETLNQYKGITTIKQLPILALKWLMKYQLTKEEIAQFSWSEEKQLLVLYQNNNYYQGRCFAPNAKSKYLSYGIKPTILYGSNTDKLVLVEDIISAIKIGRVATAIPMLGGIPLKSTESLAKTFTNVFLWNDLDLLRTSIKTARNLSERIGKHVKVVVSELDPKEYNEVEIKEYLK